MKKSISIGIPFLLIALQFGMQGCTTRKGSEPQLGRASLKKVIAALTADEKLALIVGVGDGKTPPPGVPVYDPKSGISIEDQITLNPNPIFTQRLMVASGGYPGWGSNPP